MAAKVLLLACAVSCACARRPVTEYEIDLDKPPEERYLALAPAFNATIWGFYRKYFAHDALLTDALELLSLKRGDEPDEMQREIEGFSAALGMPRRWVQALQMLYELQTMMYPHVNGTVELPAGWEALARIPWRGPGCTGIIAACERGVVYHARNLDFMPVDVMTRMVYTGIFTRGGREVFRAQMIAGYFCVVTAMRRGADGYAFERNTRFPDHAGGNAQMLRNLLSGRPLNGWSVRKVLEDVASYDDAVANISAVPFISTEYSILSGVRKGTIISRNPDGVAYVQTLGRHNFDERDDYVIITNFDFFWRDFREYLDPTGGRILRPRRIEAQRLLNATPAGALTPRALFDTLNARGVLADTIFQAIMSVEADIWNVSLPDLEPKPEDQ